VGDLTVAILCSIRDEIAGLRADTNTRLGKIEGRLDELNGRVDQTNSRLDHVCGGQIRTANEILTLRLRFEHFLASEGDVIRDLRDRMARIEAHVGID
jgi:methyl-accepting chemotaxis protein